MALEERDGVLSLRQACERDQQGATHRDADGFAVEGIAAGGVQQDQIDAEGGGVAEQAAHVVVVGDAEQRQDQGAGLVGQVGQRLAGLALGRPLAQRQDAAVDRKAHDDVHHLLAGGIDRCVVRKGGDQRRQGLGALLGDEQGRGAVSRGAGERAQHHLALGDESALASHQIALTDVAKPSNSRVLWV